jgi:hypothetical protein
MIHESYYWRNELIQISEKINKKIKIQKNWSDSKFAKFEKNIMLGFYIIRKLMEANKLTNKIGSTKFTLKMYQNNGTEVTRMNNHRFDENYNFENLIIVKRDLKFLINQFVHSYVFVPVISAVDEKTLKLMENKELTEDKLAEIYEDSERELTGILVNTDTNKNENLFEIDINSIIEIFKNVGECNVTRIEMKYNPKKEDYDIIQFDGENQISNETKTLMEKQEKKITITNKLRPK